MPPSKFRYYNKLNAGQRRIYDKSDAVPSVRLPAALPLRDSAERLAAVLAADDREATQSRAQILVDGILHRLHVAPVEVKVLAVRPSTSRQELHGLYEFGGKRRRPLISVWMRTAQKRHVVAFRTFLRTLLHEVAHHLVYQYLKLEDSYHTQGFYKRAESLYRQIAPPEEPAAAPLTAMPGASAAATPAAGDADGDPPALPTARVPRPRRPPPALAPRPERRTPKAPRPVPRPASRPKPPAPVAQTELQFPEPD